MGGRASGPGEHDGGEVGRTMGEVGMAAWERLVWLAGKGGICLG